MSALMLLAALFVSTAFCADPIPIAPTKMAPVATIDERFQSFNIEMVEVTGGRFWAPYKKGTDAATADNAANKLAVPGIDPSAFRMRPPIDLASPRLRKLAAALGPAYVRVSGTWANSTFFQDSDGPAPAAPPAGFGSVLTRQAWRGAIDFSKAVNAGIVTSFAVSDGVRDSAGVWTADQARQLVGFTKASGGAIAAAEFFNEPSFASMGGAPKGYDAAAYGRDFKLFRAFARQAAPDLIILGPGSVGEATPIAANTPMLHSADMLTASGPGVDAFSYHFYGTVSQRCSPAGPKTPQAIVEFALSEEWLARTGRDQEFYAALRDRFEPGKAMWLTETGEAACGGDPWASSFVDSFRYLDQLGRLAKRGVKIVAHNTLAASDYGLIDEDTLVPRPNYWSALLWRKLMGTTVLDAGLPPAANLHLYAHCLRGHAGGVAVLAINTGIQAAAGLTVPMPAERYTLASSDLLSATVTLNGRELKLGPNDTLPEISGSPVAAGTVDLAPESITFLAFPNAANAACR
jgi:hypothetical protein